jgi:hypothetical protein
VEDVGPDIGGLSLARFSNGGAGHKKSGNGELASAVISDRVER